MAGWIKMPLGTEVDLGPGHTLLDGDALPSPKRGTAAPLFSAHICCGQTLAYLSYCWALVLISKQVFMHFSAVVLAVMVEPFSEWWWSMFYFLFYKPEHRSVLKSNRSFLSLGHTYSRNFMKINSCSSWMKLVFLNVWCLLVRSIQGELVFCWIELCWLVASVGSLWYW